MQVIGGLTALLIGGAWLLQDAGGLLAPVGGMVIAVWAISLGNHERLKLRIVTLEQRLARAERGSMSPARRVKYRVPAQCRRAGARSGRLIFQPSSVRTNSPRLAKTRFMRPPRDEP